MCYFDVEKFISVHKGEKPARGIYKLAGLPEPKRKNEVDYEFIR